MQSISTKVLQGLHWDSRMTAGPSKSEGGVREGVEEREDGGVGESGPGEYKLYPNLLPRPDQLIQIN